MLRSPREERGSPSGMGRGFGLLSSDDRRFYNDAGNVVVPAVAASSGNDGAVISSPANRSEITAHMDIPSCQYNVSAGIWPRFHMLPIARSRKARVVGLACRRLPLPFVKRGDGWNHVETKGY